MGRFTARVVAGLVGVAVAGAPQVATAGPDRGEADLRVRIDASPTPAQPGQLISYRVRVDNAGPGDAVLPLLKVTVPGEVDIVAVNVVSCRPGAVRGEVVCPSAADVRAGEAGEMTIVGLVRPEARGPLRATAALTSQVIDPREQDNTAEVVTRVAEGADLAVRLAPPARRPRPGRRFTLRATVRNLGPGTVKDARLMLRTTGARLVSAQGTGCRPRLRFVMCRLRRPVRPGGQERLALVFRAPARAAHPVRAYASVFSDTVGDRRPANNEAVVRLPLRRR